MHCAHSHALMPCGAAPSRVARALAMTSHSLTHIHTVHTHSLIVFVAMYFARFDSLSLALRFRHSPFYHFYQHIFFVICFPLFQFAAQPRTHTHSCHLVDQYLIWQRQRTSESKQKIEFSVAKCWAHCISIATKYIDQL